MIGLQVIEVFHSPCEVRVWMKFKRIFIRDIQEKKRAANRVYSPTKKRGRLKWPPAVGLTNMAIHEGWPLFGFWMNRHGKETDCIHKFFAEWGTMSL